MVSNKRYKYALERWDEFETIANKAVAQNGRLLEHWDNAIKEIKDLQAFNKRLVSHNEELLAECRKLREQLAVVTAERDHYLDLLPDVSEVEPAAKVEAPAEDPEAQWDRYYLNV